MRPLNFAEIENIVLELKKYVGSRFQNIVTKDDVAVFELYTDGDVRWLSVLLNPVLPMILLNEKPPSFKSKTTPFALFFKANVIGKRLRGVRYSRENGRILKLLLGQEEDSVEIEIRLFPHGQNLICYAGSKKISWDKVKELKTDQEIADPAVIRTWSEIKEEFTNEKKVPSQSNTESEIQKKRTAIEKIKQNLSENKWRRIGEWLKENQSLDVPTEFLKFVDKKLKLSKNIEIAFAKSKQLEKKQAGTQERLQILEKEIQDLELAARSGTFVGKSEQRNKNSDEKSYRGFKIELNNDVIGLVGKSAKDNVDLLRKSKAWHYWIHLRDYPGAHGFIYRNKNQNIPLEDIKKVAFKLAERSKIETGEAFDVIVAECRYVKPIKGDKLGRVTYSNETHHTFKFSR